MDPVHRVFLPRLLLVADGFAAGRDGMPAPDVRRRVRESVEAGVAWVLLRDYAADEATFVGEAQELSEDLRAIEPSLILSVARHLAVAHALGAGAHTGRHGPTVAEAREAVGHDQPVGYSAHDAHETLAQAAEGVDYVVLGPIFETSTHAGRPALGTQELHAGASAAGSVPLYAIGGVTPERARECRNAGAYGIAVLGGILDAPAERVGEYLRALRPSEPA